MEIRQKNGKEVNMQINIEIIGNTLVAKLFGELDHHCCDEVRAAVDREIERGRIKNLVFDLDGVSFMDSSGIGVIAGRYKKIKEFGGRTLIVRARPQVDRVLELSGIKKILECG